MENKAKKRAKKQVLAAVIIDRAELEQTVSRAAALQLQRDALTIEMDQRLATIKEEYKAKIGDLNDTLSELVRRIENFCRRHRDEMFGGKQGCEVLGHKLEFRQSPGKVETAKGIKLDDIVEQLLSLGDEEFADTFLRYKTELDKESVLKHWDADHEVLERLGLMVTKPELFQFTPDRQAISRVERAAA